MTDYMNDFRFFLIGPYPNGELGGLAISLILALITMVSGFVLGMILALGRISKKTVISKLLSLIHISEPTRRS